MSSTTTPTEANLISPLSTNELPIEAERILLRTTKPLALPKPEDSIKNRISESLRPKETLKSEPPPEKNRLAGISFPSGQLLSSVAGKTIDRAYFPLRAWLPEAALLTLLSLGWLMGVVPNLPSWWQSWEIIALVPGTYGLYLAVKWLFQALGGGYRLTNQQILRVTPGPIPNPDPIDLAMIAGLEIEQSLLERFLFVGHIRITFERDTLPPAILGPVGWPRGRANRIREAMEAARGSTVTALKSN